jgi:phytoene/squalene synthetase
LKSIRSAAPSTISPTILVPREGRRAQLAQWRADIDALYRGAAPPQLAGLARPSAPLRSEREDFIAVIDGMEMDVVADIRAPDRPTLELYCDRVACAVGRLSVRVFGMPADSGRALAHHLGSALQLTNILRDLDEDASLGRLYLPREVLQAHGIIATDPAKCWHIRRSARPARTLSSSLAGTLAKRTIMARCPRRIVRAPRIMGEAYRTILDAWWRAACTAPRGFACRALKLLVHRIAQFLLKR